LQLRAITKVEVTAIAIGEVNNKELAPLLDVSLVHSNKIDGFISGKISALTADKDGDVAESYRSATYSILEILGLE
jgi:hypothetical protein